MIKKLPNIILLGSPGSGKGSLAKQLVDRLGYKHFSTGDLFRETMNKDTPLSKQIKETIARGDLISDDITNAMIKDYLVNAVKHNQHFILDGYPRNLKQAEFTASIVDIDKVIYIDIAEELAIKRISGRISCPKCKAVFNTYFTKPKDPGICDCCGTELIHRKDDNIESAKHRFDVYKEQTQPLINYYRKKNKLIGVIATENNNIYDDVIKIIK